MNILDENIPPSQRLLLKSWHVPVRHMGYEIGQKGMKDGEITPFLVGLRRPTFFTLDSDFCKRSLCHARYCLVYMDVRQYETATFVRRLLHHPEFDTQAKRVGAIIRLSHAGLWVWRLHAEKEVHFSWRG